MRLRGLHINSLWNILVKYKYNENVDLLEIVTCQGKLAIFNEIILSVKYNRSKMFMVVKNRIEKHKDSAFLLIKLTLRMVAWE